jgi:perosamine synthetase
MHWMKFGLIPRYNWDYSIIDLFRAIYGLTFNGNRCLYAGNKNFGKELVFVNSGRSALYTILKVMNFPPGALIGVPLFCCPVVFNTIVKSGNTPVFIDIGSDDYNISIDDKKLRRSDLSAVVAVDMFGDPADITGIANRCRPGIPIIQDCAQSLYSISDNGIATPQSHISFYSFRSGKYLSIGEAGVIVCRNPDFLTRIMSMVDTFPESSYVMEIITCFLTYFKSCFYKRPLYGVVGLPIGRILDAKMNLTGKSGFHVKKILKSALYLTQHKLNSFKDKVDQQIENSHFLANKIADKSLLLIDDVSGNKANWYQFPLSFQSENQRDAAYEALVVRGIDCAKYLDEVVATAYAEYGYSGDCPMAEKRAKTTLCIPNYYTLKQKDLDKIFRAINDL